MAAFVIGYRRRFCGLFSIPLKILQLDLLSSFSGVKTIKDVSRDVCAGGVYYAASDLISAAYRVIHNFRAICRLKSNGSLFPFIFFKCVVTINYKITDTN